MYQFRRILKMDLVNLFTNPMWLFYTTAFPFALTLILGFLAKGSYSDNITSYDFYGITTMIYSALNAATLAANSFMEKDIKGPNMRLIYAPVPSFAIYFPKIIATVIFTTVCYTAVALLLRVTVHVNFGETNTIYLWLLMILVEIFAASFSVMLCCVLKTEAAVNQILSFAITLMTLLGGVFFPVDGLGKTVTAVSNLSPVKWVALSAFQIIYDGKFTLLLPACIILAVVSVICILFSTKFFKTEDFV